MKPIMNHDGLITGPACDEGREQTCALIGRIRSPTLAGGR
jgi:hypothetical protein